MIPHSLAATRRPALLSWGIVALGAVYFGYGYYLRVSPSVMIDDLMRDFAVTAVALGNLSAVYFYVYAFMQVPVGAIVDRAGPRRVLVVAGSICVAGTAIFASADGIGGAYLGRALIGFGASAAWISTMALAMTWLPPQRFAMVAGLANLVGMAGATMAQAPLSLLIGEVGWRTAMWGSAGVGALIVMAVWLTRFAGRPSFAEERPDVSAPALQAVVYALRQRSLWAIALFCGFSIGPMLSFAVLWAVPYATEVYAVDKTTAGTMASAMLLGWGIGAPCFGWISDWAGRRKPALLLGSLGALVSWPVILFVPALPLPLLYGLLFWNGWCTGAFIVGFAVAKEMSSRYARATGIAMINATSMIATALFQVLIGFLLDLTWSGRGAAGVRLYDAESYTAAFCSVPLMMLATLSLLWLVPETFCRQQVE